MNTIEQFEAALGEARQLGYEIRLERLDGQEGGACEVKGRKQLFIDLSLPAREQLETLLEALSSVSPASPVASSRAAPISTRAA